VLVKFTKTTDFSYSSSPISLDEKVKGKTSSVCISLETKKKNSCQTSDEKNTEIQVNYIGRTIIYNITIKVKTFII
jgi:hypothetical protein